MSDYFMDEECVSRGSVHIVKLFRSVSLINMNLKNAKLLQSKTQHRTTEDT